MSKVQIAATTTITYIREFPLSTEVTSAIKQAQGELENILRNSLPLCKNLIIDGTEASIKLEERAA